MSLLDQYKEACNFPGKLDVAAVEKSLAAYCSALGVRREIVRLPRGWSLEKYPPLSKMIHEVLTDFEKRSGRKPSAALDALDARAAHAASDAHDAHDARAAHDAHDALDAHDARAAHDALDAHDARAARAARAAHDAHDALAALDARAARAARAAHDASAARAALAASAASDALVTFSPLHSFAEWCIYRRTWWWTGELSWFSTTHVGAVQLQKPTVLHWSQHVFDAYVSGAWLLVWTDTTLYWIAKPTVTTELVNGRRQLHNATGPTLECDVQNLYFWHGVMVPAFVVVKPEWITLKHIETEDNAEVRRVMIERYGTARYIKDSGAEVVHELPDNYYVKGLQGAKLYRKPRKDDSDIIMISVANSTPEPDGSIKQYMLRIQPDAYNGAAAKDCHAAMASTWRRQDGTLYFSKPQDYRPEFES